MGQESLPLSVCGGKGSASASHPDRKSTRLNSSHVRISYAVFCLKKKNKNYQKSRELQPKAHKIIHGFDHTYGKRDDQFPEHAPGFIIRGKDCHSWDSLRNEFIE